MLRTRHQRHSWQRLSLVLPCFRFFPSLPPFLPLPLPILLPSSAPPLLAVSPPPLPLSSFLAVLLSLEPGTSGTDRQVLCSPRFYLHLNINANIKVNTFIELQSCLETTYLKCEEFAHKMGLLRYELRAIVIFARRYFTSLLCKS